MLKWHWNVEGRYEQALLKKRTKHFLSIRLLNLYEKLCPSLDRRKTKHTTQLAIGGLLFGNQKPLEF